MSRSFVAVRKISEAEAAVLERSLSVAAIDYAAEALINQISALQIVGRCSCGCASIDFLHPAQGQKARIVADADATAASGEYVGGSFGPLTINFLGLSFTVIQILRHSSRH